MERCPRTVLIVVVFILGLLRLPAIAQASVSVCEADGKQTSGAIYRICFPSGAWNGDLVVYAHGYVSPTEPEGMPEDKLFLPDGTSIPEIVNGMGYAFATTSFRKNGLAFVEGVEDIRDLVSIFTAAYRNPRHVYLVGASEGGLVTVLTIEKYPDVFSGGMALCGPIGDFRRQLNYVGDFKVIFDYLFPGILPGGPDFVPPEVMENWDSYYEPLIRNAVLLRPEAAEELLRATRAPIDPGDSNSTPETVIDLLWYNVFATNDAVLELGGHPFDNTRRIYFGAKNDFRLNRLVTRLRADPNALDEIAARYQTTGSLKSPLVTVHTTEDPVVPYWHEKLYRLRAFTSGSGSLHKNIPISRYGHCNFKASEALGGFLLLVSKVTGQELLSAEAVLPDADALIEFRDLMKRHGPAR
jgi:pimeloyl-ACP methyl ester carboxylesterase